MRRTVSVSIYQAPFPYYSDNHNLSVVFLPRYLALVVVPSVQRHRFLLILQYAFTISATELQCYMLYILSQLAM